MKQYLLFCVLVIASISGFAQAPQLVEDIVPGSISSMPQSLTLFNGQLYFTAQTPLYGSQLYNWHTMGVPATRLTDTLPGAGLGGPFPGGSEPMCEHQGKLYFFGFTHDGQNNLIAYDGVNPPSAVVSVAKGLAGPVPVSLISYGDRLYFLNASDNPTNPWSYLYSYNGSGSPDTISRAMVNPNTLIPFNGKIYFSYDNGVSGHGLGVYDTLTGQVSYVPATADLHPHKFLEYGNKIYFAGSDGTFENLFSYDGATLTKLTDTLRITRGVYLDALAGFKGSIYFSVNSGGNHYALYRYDTSAKATSLVYDPVPDSVYTSIPVSLYAAPNNLYFYYSRPETGIELYQCNGSTGRLVADLNPGQGNGAGKSNLLYYKGYVYFTGDGGLLGQELYRISDDVYTGVHSSGFAAEFSIYPNPVSTTATLIIGLQSPQSLRIALTDIGGRDVYTTGLQSFITGKNQVTIPMQRLAAGQYFYRITDSRGRALAWGKVAKL